ALPSCQIARTELLGRGLVTELEGGVVSHSWLLRGGGCGCRCGGHAESRGDVFLAEAGEGLAFDLQWGVVPVALDQPGDDDDVRDARVGELGESTGAVLVDARHLAG